MAPRRSIRCATPARPWPSSPAATRISRAAAAMPPPGRPGVPVNVVDRLALCDFTTPALIDRGQVVAAVGSARHRADAGRAAAQRRRARACRRAPGRVAAHLRRAACKPRSAPPCPLCLPAAPALRVALAGPAADAALARRGDGACARALLRAALADHAADRPIGRICVIAEAEAVDHLPSAAAPGGWPRRMCWYSAPRSSPAILDLARHRRRSAP